MFSYHGGESVRGGFYWNPGKWEIAPVARGGVLPGSGAERYIKVPILLVLVLAPLLGFLYVIFLPFIGFALVLGLAGRKGIRALRKALAQVGRIVSPARS